MLDANEINNVITVLLSFSALCSIVGGVLIWLIGQKFVTKEIFYAYVESQSKISKEITDALHEIKFELKTLITAFEANKKKQDDIDCTLEAMKDRVTVLEFINKDK